MIDDRNTSLFDTMVGTATLLGVSSALFGTLARTTRELQAIIDAQARAAVSQVRSTAMASVLAYTEDLLSSMRTYDLKSAVESAPRYTFQRHLPLRNVTIESTDVSHSWIGAINKALLEKHLGRQTAAAISVAKRDVESVLSHIEHDYQGLLHTLGQATSRYSNQMEGRIDIVRDGIREIMTASGNYYVIPLREVVTTVDGREVVKRTREVTLPVLRYGQVNVHGSRYMPVLKGERITIGGKPVIITKAAGRRTVEAIAHSLQFSSYSTDVAFIDKVVRSVENSVAVTLTGENITTLNSIVPIVTRSIEDTTLRTLIETAPYADKFGAIRQHIATLHGMDVVMQVYDPTRGELANTTIGKIHLSKSSDTGATTKGKFRMGDWSLFDHYERPFTQSPTRMRMIAGFPRAPYTLEELAATVGIVSRRSLESIVAANYNETIPGGISQIAVYFGKAPLPGIGEGSIIAFDSPTPKGHSTAKFTGWVEKNYDVMLTNETKHAIEQRVREGRTRIEKGEMLGYRVDGTPIIAEATGELVAINKVNDQLRLTVKTISPLRVGTKLGSDKLVVSMIRDPKHEYAKNVDMFYRARYGIALPQLTSKHPEVNAVVNMIAGGYSRGNAVEFLLDWEMAQKRYSGGRLGEGIMMKILSDVARREKVRYERWRNRVRPTIKEQEHYKARVEKRIHALVRSAFGDGVADNIEKIVLTGDGWDVAVITRRDADVARYTSTMLNLEKLVKDAEKGDVEGLLDFVEVVQASLKEHKLRNVRLVGDVGHFARMNNPGRISHMLAAPAFLLDSSTRRLTMMVFSTFVFPHQASAYMTFGTPSRVRSLGGYPGGAAITLDHIRNAELMGLHHMTNWLVRLLDYNYPYLEDKVIAGISPVLSVAEMFEARTKGIGIGSVTKRVHLIEQSNLFGSGKSLGERLIDNFEQQSQIVGAIRRLYQADTIINPMSQLPKEVVEGVLAGRFSTLTDILKSGQIGIKANSLGLIDETTTKQLLEMVNSAPKGSVVYLELPMEVNVDGNRVRYVPVSRFAPEDMFRIELAKEAAGKIKQAYYTGSEVHTETVNLFMNVAKASQMLRERKDAARAEYEIGNMLSTSVRRYLSTVRAISGKNNPVIRRLTSIEAPFSMVGTLARLDTLGIGEVGVTEDAFVRMITNSAYRSVDELKEAVKRGKEIERARKVVHLLLSDIEGLMAPKESEQYRKVAERVIQLARTTSPAKAANDKAALLYHRLVHFASTEIGELPRDLQRSIRSLKGLPKARQKPTSFGSLVWGATITSPNSPIANLRATLQGWQQRANREYVAAQDAYRFLDIVEEVKARDTMIGVRAQGTPELSRLSGVALRLRILDANNIKELAASTLPKVPLDDLVFMREETAIAIGRDFDKDILALFIETFAALDKTFARKDTKVNLARDFGLDKNLARWVTVEHIAQQIIDRAVELKPDGTTVTPRPASLSSHMLMQALEEKARGETFYAVPFAEFVNEQLSRAGVTFKNAKEKAKVIAKIIRLVNDSVDVGTNKLRVLLSGQDIPDDLVEEWKKPANAFRVAKEAVTAGAPLLTQSEMGWRERDALTSMMKETLHSYMRGIAVEDAERFSLIKGLTPAAYNLHNAVLEIIRLYDFRQGSSPKNREIARQMRDRLTMFADKIIAQNTISSKHGNPNIIADLEKALRTLEANREQGYEEAISKIASGNFILDVGDAEHNRIKAYGFKTENVDFNTYDEYLRLREDIARHARKAHERAQVLFQIETTSDPAQLYRAYVEHEIASYRIASPNSAYYRKQIKDLPESVRNALTFNGALFNPQVAEIEHETALKSVSVADKFTKSYITTLHGSKGAKMWGEYVEAAARERELKPEQYFTATRALRKAASTHTEVPHALRSMMIVYSELGGSSVFERGDERGARLMEPRADASIGESVERYLYRLAQAEEPARLSSFSVVDRLVQRLSVWIGNAKGARVGTPLPGYLEKSVSRIMREVNRIGRAQVAEMMEREFSPFSDTASLFGKAATRMEAAGTRAAAKATGRLRGIALAVGTLTGIALGQLITSSIEGYPVPGLDIHSGEGGEYLERGIMGKIPEVAFPQQPPRVVRWDRVEHDVMRDLDMIDAAASLREVSMPSRQFKSPFRGVVVG